LTNLFIIAVGIYFLVAGYQMTSKITNETEEVVDFDQNWNFNPILNIYIAQGKFCEEGDSPLIT